MRKAILIADDNPFIRTALYEFFQREPDFQVCAVVEDGRQAVEQADRLHPDLIILDLSMPVMNGLDAARVLKQVMPNVPVIVYSAAQDEFSKQLAKSMGISEVISKSDRISVLIDAARNLVRRKAA